MQMIFGKTYFIYQPGTEYYSHAFYKAIYVGYGINYQYQPTFRFDNVIEIGYSFDYGTMNFGMKELYYDAEKIKDNAKKARQSMEKRALDQILKRLIDPHFEWY